MNLNETELRYYFKEKYNYSELKIDELLKKENPKVAGPLAYALGYVDFLDTKIDLRYKPLIPRPETEYWVEYVINRNKNDKNINVLDIFSGSGCIGIAILKHIKDSKVTFVDISKDAIAQIKLNLDINNIKKNRYKVIKSDIFKDIDTNKFDIILANPPYVSINDEYGEEILVEPKVAIFANDDGMDIIKRFLDKVFGYLSNTGILYMEMGESQKERIQNYLKIPNARIIFEKDQYGRDRVLEIKKATS